MSLLYHELVHLALSLIIGFFVWKKYKQIIPSFTAAIFGGFLIDFDHLFDYFLAYGFNFNLNIFLDSGYFHLNDKIYVPLHAWEYLIVLSIIYLFLHKKFLKLSNKISKILLSLILALLLGMFSHLIVDSTTNSMTIPGYSIIYRVINNYREDILTK